MALAIDHRVQLEDVARETGRDDAAIAAFKVLAVEAAARVAQGRPGYGMLLDDKHGREALFAAQKHGFWIGKPFEDPGSRPLRFEFSQDAGGRLIDWHIAHCIKVLCFYHPDDEPALKAAQIKKLTALSDAAHKVGRELLIEIIAGKHGALDEQTIPRALEEMYAAGLKPDWWKLEPQASEAAWRSIDATIKRHDPWCRGVVLLGLEAPQAELEAGFAAAQVASVVKGFAVGRTIFGDAAKAWLGGRISDEEAIADMANRFGALTAAWARVSGKRSD